MNMIVVKSFLRSSIKIYRDVGVNTALQYFGKSKFMS